MRRPLHLFLLCAACGDGSPPAPPAFEPELVFEYSIEAGPELDFNRTTDSESRTSKYLTGDEALRGERYRVPDYPCLRADGTDWNDLPEGAVTPGEPAHFEIVYPPEDRANGTLVFSPHGDGLEFIEAFSIEIWKEFPDVAEDNGVHPETGSRGVEQSTRFGAKRNMVAHATGRFATQLALAGATVVIPGNCWADGGHGMGATTGDGYYRGRRLGGAFDQATWAWAQQNLEHDPQRAVGFACSGGGHRLAEQLARDGSSFRVIVLDSPADMVTEFLSEPRPDLMEQVILFLRPVRFDEVMEQFFSGTWGGRQRADDAALANNVDQVPAEVPIYLSYSENDRTVPPQLVEPLAQALAGRDGATVLRLDIEKHCQIDTDEGMQDAMAWLDEQLGLTR